MPHLQLRLILRAPARSHLAAHIRCAGAARGIWRIGGAREAFDTEKRLVEAAELLRRRGGGVLRQTRALLAPVNCGFKV